MEDDDDDAAAEMADYGTDLRLSRSKLSGPFIVILTAVLKSQLDHENPELLVRVIDVDEPGTGRIPRTSLGP
jgi:hypothetical protein